MFTMCIIMCFIWQCPIPLFYWSFMSRLPVGFSYQHSDTTRYTRNFPQKDETVTKNWTDKRNPLTSLVKNETDTYSDGRSCHYENDGSVVHVYVDERSVVEKATVGKCFQLTVLTVTDHLSDLCRY